MLVAFTARAAGMPVEIDIQQRNGAYELTVPASRLAITIPRGNLILKADAPGSVANPRYFFFEDDTQHMIVSGWFEPDPGFPGIAKFWEDQTKTWRENGLPEPHAVSVARISDWEAVIYDMALPFGHNSHIRAHWVQAGTWIDLHLSITSEDTSSENRAKLRRTLKSIQVRQKE